MQNKTQGPLLSSLNYVPAWTKKDYSGAFSWVPESQYHNNRTGGWKTPPRSPNPTRKAFIPPGVLAADS